MKLESSLQVFNQSSVPTSPGVIEGITLRKLTGTPEHPSERINVELAILADTALTAPDEWAERIAAQRRSGMSVKQFCKEQGLTEYSFYSWRKRLQEKGPVRFALVERSARRQERVAEAVLELVLATGERLRIGAGVDVATLRAVLDVLRA